MGAGGSDLEQYLATTPMCDYDHPSIQEHARALVASAQTEQEKAALIVGYVRDAIRFGIAFSHSRASQILQRGYGECVTKTNVQIALLRAVGIPARMRWVLAQSQALAGLIAPLMLRSMKKEASHFWAQCYLGGHWISCEALFDGPLYHGMLRQGLVTTDQIPTIDWDGEHDLEILTPWITSDQGVVTSADDAVRAYQGNDEGAPPVWIERLMAPVFVPYSLRFSDRIRRSAPRSLPSSS